MPLDINLGDILKHLKVGNIPLGHLLAAFDARAGDKLSNLVHTLQCLVEQGKLQVTIRLARPFPCLFCKKKFASEHARDQHPAAKHSNLATREEH